MLILQSEFCLTRIFGGFGRSDRNSADIFQIKSVPDRFCRV